MEDVKNLADTAMVLSAVNCAGKSNITATGIIIWMIRRSQIMNMIC